MRTLLFVATDHGVVACVRDGEGWIDVSRSLENRKVTSIIAREGVVLAGTTQGVFRAVPGMDGEADLGRIDWQPASDGLIEQHIRWMAYYPGVSGLEFAGTEPAGIFISYDGADSWRICPEVSQLRDRHGWRLPYSPRAGCVRGFAFHGQRAYAAVEDGCVLVSDNSGEKWRLAEGSRGSPDHNPFEGYIHSDVHSIEVHPSSADLVTAPTGGGLYRSRDGGRTWNILYRCYTRAAWLDPGDERHIIFGPADSVDYNGRIEESMNGGQTWSPASLGLEVPWNHHMVERFIQVEDELYAVLSNGELIAASLSSLEWRRILPEVGAVAAITPMRVEG